MDESEYVPKGGVESCLESVVCLGLLHKCCCTILPDAIGTAKPIPLHETRERATDAIERRPEPAAQARAVLGMDRTCLPTLKVG